MKGFMLILMNQKAQHRVKYLSSSQMQEGKGHWTETRSLVTALSYSFVLKDWIILSNFDWNGWFEISINQIFN